MGADSDKEKVYALLNEIKALIEENEEEDGTFRFDSVRAMIALDFAKTEIIRSVEKNNLTLLNRNPGMD